MTDKQTQIAIKILLYLSDKSNFGMDGNGVFSIVHFS